MADRIQVRRDTAANWTSANPTLAQGEIGYETDTDKVKIGDGTTAWTSLGYVIDTGAYLQSSDIGTSVQAYSSVLQNTTASFTTADDARLDLEPITPQDYGAVGDGTTDDTTAMQSWVTELRTNGGYGYLPAGTYKVSTLYMHPEESYLIQGAGFDKSVILVENTSRTGIGLKFTHTDGTTRNTGNWELRDLRVQSHANNKACLLEHHRASGPRLTNVKFIHYTGSTALRLTEVYNGEASNVPVWGAGHNVPFKDVGSTTFSITSGTTTLTASAAVFAAGDVGRKITLFTSSGGAQVFEIASYTSTTSVEVTANAENTYTASAGSFGGVRGTTTSSSTTLTLEADVLTSDDIGRVVYVVGAGPTVIGATIPLRTTITSVSGTSITLADAATAAVTNAELVFDPAVDFGNSLNSYSDYTNDFAVEDLMIEQFYGTGLVASGITFRLDRLKVHGPGPTGVDDAASNIPALFSYFQGYVSGTFEQLTSGNLGRIVIAGGNGGWTPDFLNIEVLPQHGQPIFYGTDFGQGTVGIGHLKTVGNAIVDFDTSLSSGDGSVTFVRSGVISQYGSTFKEAPAYNDVLFTDRTNSRVGVKTRSPQTDFHVAGDTTLGGGVTETVYALSGTTPALDPSNGTVQTWTLTGNSAPTDSLSAGEAITLMIDDGTAYTITWPTMTWVNNGGSAPTLATTGYTVIALWKVSTTLYGALVGDGS